MISSNSRSGLVTVRRGLLAAPVLLVLTAAGLLAQDFEGYSYFRAVDGRAELIAGDTGERTEIETNYPIVTGDRLLVDQSAQVDLLLSDGSQVAVDEVTDLTFTSIAGSPDAEEDQTVLRLYEGRVLVASHGVWRDGVESTIIDTANARIYLQSNGDYLVTADEARWTELVVRDGFAEVVDQNGSSVVRAGERLELRGSERPRAEIEPAGSLTSLETFADRQEVLAARASDPRLDEPLYGTSSLDEQGDWVVIDSRRAWRPTVTVREWRPYWRGRWAYTPGGLYWVSSDPWSPVVYHYGAWDYHSAFGWVWYPGRVYSPGHVYWYWGPSYAGWVPRGYYDNYYRRHYGFDFGFRFGVFGRIGGTFASFDRWTFCPIDRFGYRGYSHYLDTRSLRYYGRGHLDRGYLFTDSTRLTPDRWHRPELVRIALERGWHAERGLADRGADSIPDVTPFVERKGRLSPDTERNVLVKGRQGPRTDDPFPTRVAVSRTRAGDDAGRSVGDRRPTVDRGASASSGRLASSGSERGTPRAITRRPGDEGAPATATGRSTLRRPSTDRDSGGRDSGSSTTGSTRAAPARRVLDGIRGRSQGSPTARSSADGDRTVTSRRPTAPPSGRTTVERSTPPSRSSSSRVTTPPSRSSSSRVTTPPSRSSSSRVTTPPSRSSSTRSTPPSGRTTVQRSTPPTRSSSSRVTTPPSRSSSTRSAPPSGRTTVQRSTPPTRSSSSARSAPPSSRNSSSRVARPSSRSTSSRVTTSPSRGSSARSAPSGRTSVRSPATSGDRSRGSVRSSSGSSRSSAASRSSARSAGSRSQGSRPSRSSSRRPPDAS
jgi:hypothetical protein